MRTTEGRGDNELSNNVPEVVEESAEDFLVYSPQASTISSSSSEEYEVPDGPDMPSAAESPEPINLQEEHQLGYSNVGTSIQHASTSSEDPSTSTQGKVNIPRAVDAPAALSVQCRICDAPPTVDTQPTVTMCGHLFCYECVLKIPSNKATRLTSTRCITQQVLSNSRCPVCDDALLLYCLFKLDLLVLS